ncbi:PD40 domain-containing protein [bacterium]|nr:PD40 domain-containing protein [bacterium]
MRWCSRIIIFCIVLCLLQTIAFGRIRIDIYGPVLVPFPVAVAPFTFSGGASQGIAMQVESILINDLEISGFFSVTDIKGFPPGAMAGLKNPKAIDLALWSGMPQEALVSGGITLAGENVDAHFRLFDLVEQSFVTGLRYRAPLADLRNMSHRMADEITFHLTGQVGVSHTKIAFILNNGKSKEVYVIDFDGNGITRLTNHDSICLSPAWSPDGKNIAYTCFRKRNPDLYVYNMERKNFRIASSRVGVNGAPAWSPDGTKIALMIRDGDRSRIAIVNSIGAANPLFLTSGGGNEASPVWSPDGQKLAFVSDRSGNPQIYTIGSNGKGLTRITFEGKYNASPAWSPVGDKIAFCSMINGNFDIFVCNPDGRNIQRLTQNAGNNEDPTWSPDGRFIAFSSDRRGISNIYCMNANGANVRRVTFSKFQETGPAWSPYLI